MARLSFKAPISIFNKFRQIAIDEGLKEKTKAYKKRRRAFVVEAVQSGFNSQFGSDESSLQAWQGLCITILGVNACGGLNLSSISGCKRALRGTFVNIIDLVDAANAGKEVRKTFSSQRKLSQYIKQTEKFFPKEKAKGNPLLAEFLIVVD